MGKPLPITYGQAWVEHQVALLGGPEDWRNFPWGISRGRVSLRHLKRDYMQAHKRFAAEMRANGHV